MQYTRNTVTGSSTADVIVLLVDARKGVIEQTRRHLAVASLLRVPHVILVVNKIDLVDFSEDVFTQIATDFALLSRSLGVRDTHCIPVSATEGDNVVTRSHRTPWYDGPTVLGYLENVDDTPLAVGEEFRFPVQHVVRPQSAVLAPWAASTPAVDGDYRGYAGKVESGRVRVGEEIVVLPRSSHAVVEAIDTPDGPLEIAVAGQSVVLRLDSDIDVSRGDILAATDAPPAPVREVTATVCWLAERDICGRCPGARPARHLADQGHRQGHRGGARPGLRGGHRAVLAADQLLEPQRHRSRTSGPRLPAADRPLPRAPGDRRLHHRRRGRRVDAGRWHGRLHPADDCRGQPRSGGLSNQKGPVMAAPSLILLGYGSHDPRVAQVSHEIRTGLLEIRPELDIHVAFLEQPDNERTRHPCPPSGMQVIAKLVKGGVSEVVVVPLLLSDAFHSDVEVPALVAQANATYPDLRITASRPIGPEAQLLSVIDRRLRDALRARRVSELDGLVFAAAGSSDIRSNAIVARRARQWATHHRLPCVTAFATGSGPTAAEAVRTLRSQGRRHIAVGSWFLSPGLLYMRQSQLAFEAGAVAVSDPMGGEPEIAEVALTRYVVSAMDLVDLDAISAIDEDEPAPHRHLSVVSA